MPEAHASEALKPVLTAITQTQGQVQLSALAAAYKAVADKLPASSLRPNAKLLRDARELARDDETWLKVATAELSVLPDLALDDAERLTADLLRDPLCIGDGRKAVLNAFARRLDAQPDKKPDQPWGNDIWAFVAWAKNERGGFDPDRAPPLD